MLSTMYLRQKYKNGACAYFSLGGRFGRTEPVFLASFISFSAMGLDLCGLAARGGSLTLGLVLNQLMDAPYG